MSDGTGAIDADAGQRQGDLAMERKVKARQTKRQRRSQSADGQGVVKIADSTGGSIRLPRHRKISAAARWVGIRSDRVIPAWPASLVIIAATIAVCTFAIQPQAVETIRYIEVERPATGDEYEFSNGLKLHLEKK